MVFPAAVLVLGARAWTSLWGIVAILVGQWHADRVWDDSVVSEDANPNHGNVATASDIASVTGEYLESAYEFMDSAHRAVTNPESPDCKRVQHLFRGPTSMPLLLACVGWLLLATSFLLSCQAHQQMSPSKWNVTLFGLLVFFLLLLIAVLQTVIRPLAIYDRSVHEHAHFFTFTLFGAYVLLGVFVGWDRHNDAPFWMPLVAGAAIAIAPNLLWFCTKRGDTFDRAAVRNPRPVLYNVGGPLLVTGWLMFWIAMNYVDNSDFTSNSLDRRTWYLPIYWTSRTAVALESALAIFGAYWATGYAQDEHDDTDQHPSILDGSRMFRPLKSFLFGRVMEMRLAFVITWFMMAVTAFLPTWSEGGKFSSFLLFLALVAQGFAVGVQHVLGVRGADEHKLQKWSRVSVALLAFIVLVVFLSKEFAAPMLTLLGSAAMVTGWQLLQKERKRGNYWMETGQSNPFWTAYSYGVILFPLGLLLFAWGLSIP
jgi:Ca2+/Na+ antiporter